VSLLNATATGHSDAVGGYVLTASDGGFQWTGDAACAPGDELYVYSLGGSVGGEANSAAGLLAVVGKCPAGGDLGALPYVWVNEVSTVVAAYAMAGFAVDATHVSSSGTALALAGIANAFAGAANLSSASTGVVYEYTPGENGIVPQSEINTLADALAACAGSGGAGSSRCSALFSSTLSGGLGGVVPTDTATAAINIAHNPLTNVSALYVLGAGLTAFVPGLGAAPNDWTVSVSYFGGGLSRPQGIAIDGLGNVWAANVTTSSLSEFSSAGVALSSGGGYSGGGLDEPTAVAIDLTGNAWVANLSGTGESEFSSYTPLSPANGFAICAAPYSHGVAVDGSNQIWFANTFGFGGIADAEGLTNAGCVSALTDTGAPIPPGGFGAGYLDNPYGIAIDSAGSAWIANQGGSSVTKLSSTGAPISPFAGYTGGGLNAPSGIAIDGPGNVWMVNSGNSTLTKLSNLGAALSPSAGFAGGGLSGPAGLAIDGRGNAWVANFGGNSVSEFSNAGAVLSPTGFLGQGVYAPAGIAVDGSGNVWVTNDGDNVLVEFIGAAAPVVTPLAMGVKNNSLGTRP